MHKCPPPVPILSQIHPVIALYPTTWRFNLYYRPIYAWVFQVVFSPQVSPPNSCTHFSCPHNCYVPRSSHFSRFGNPKNIWWEVHLVNSLETFSVVLFAKLYLAKIERKCFYGVYTHSPTYTISRCAISNLWNSQVKNVIPCGMNVQWQQSGRRTLLSNNTDGGAVTLPPIRSRSVGV